MNCKNGFRFTSEDGNVHEIVVAFSGEEVHLLRQYRDQVNDVRETAFYREGGGVRLRMAWTEVDGLSAMVITPSWDDVQLVLHKLRPLILQREPASFHRIKGLIGRHFKDSPLGGILKSLDDQYSGRRMQSMVRMRSNDSLMNSEEMLFTWLNAHEYHRDGEKARFLETLHRVLPLKWSQGVFVSLIIEKIKAADALSLLCDLVLGERQTLDIRI